MKICIFRHQEGGEAIEGREDELGAVGGGAGKADGAAIERIVAFAGFKGGGEVTIEFAHIAEGELVEAAGLEVAGVTEEEEAGACHAPIKGTLGGRFTGGGYGEDARFAGDVNG